MDRTEHRGTRAPRAGIALALLVLACGCDGAAGPSSVPPGSSPADTCGAADYRGLVGAPLAAVTLPADLDDRVLRPGQPATMDYRASRLNIVVDAAGMIVDLRCG